MEKFRILDLTNYSRVLFLDADIMPLCSLDYLFELSEPENGPAVLKENVVLAWRLEAANAAVFMLQPSRENYLELQDVIFRKEQKSLDLPWPHWDPVEGWGHEIASPDFWRSPNKATGTNWTWHAVFADQGLLYHWTKYVKQSVSLIIGEEVENWSSKNGVAYLEGTMQEIFNNYSCVPARKGRNQPSFPHSDFKHAPPYRDFKHFTGKSFLFMISMKRPCLFVHLNLTIVFASIGSTKPWKRNQLTLFETVPLSRSKPIDYTEHIDCTEQWYRALQIAELQTGIKLNFDFAKGEVDARPPVGRFSRYGQIIKHIRAKASRNWTAYARTKG
jgi:hypothetical protein